MVNLKYDWLMMMSLGGGRCGQLLPRAFMVYKMKSSIRASDFGTFGFISF